MAQAAPTYGATWMARGSEWMGRGGHTGQGPAGGQHVGGVRGGERQEGSAPGQGGGGGTRRLMHAECGAATQEGKEVAAAPAARLLACELCSSTPPAPEACALNLSAACMLLTATWGSHSGSPLQYPSHSNSAPSRLPRRAVPCCAHCLQARHDA